MIRVGLIGCGFMGRMHANVYGLLNNAQLVTVADRKPEKADSFGEEFGIPSYGSLADMVSREQLDAIDICLPTHLHKEATLQAASAGKHVLCEKPMALTVEDAEEMIQACQRAGVKLMIGHCIRFWPEYALLKRYTDEQTLGKLVSINLTRYGEFPSWSTDNWLADESLSGGGVLDMHIHDTDFILHLLGEPLQMSSFGSLDSRGASHAFTTLAYPNCIAHLEGGWNLPTKTPFKMMFRAIFERGAMVMDGGPLTIYEDGKSPTIPEFPKMEAKGGGNISDLGGYYHEIKYFIDKLADGGDFEKVTPESSKLSLQTALSEVQQIRENARKF